MKKQLFTGFRFTQQAPTFTRLVHEGRAIQLKSRVSVIEPAEISWDTLSAWVLGKARKTDDEWIFADDVIGDFDSMGDESFDALMCEIATWLHGVGVSITPGMTDHTAYQYATDDDDE